MERRERDIGTVFANHMEPFAKFATLSAAVFGVAYAVGFFYIGGMFEGTAARWVAMSLSPVQVVIAGFPTLLAMLGIPTVLGAAYREGLITRNWLSYLVISAALIFLALATSKLLVTMWWPDRYIPGWREATTLSAFVTFAAMLLHRLDRDSILTRRGFTKGPPFVLMMSALALGGSLMLGKISGQSKLTEFGSTAPYVSGDRVCNERVLLPLGDGKILTGVLTDRAEDAVFFVRELTALRYSNNPSKCVKLHA